MTRKKLYLLLFLGTFAGYCWLVWSLWFHKTHNDFTPCLFKNATGIACPSCGSTRSLLEITKGNFTEAFLINPLGYVIALLLLIFPLWLLYDIIFNKDSLYKSYGQFEKTLKIKGIALILILLILANWAWNIQKGL